MHMLAIEIAIEIYVESQSKLLRERETTRSESALSKMGTYRLASSLPEREAH